MRFSVIITTYNQRAHLEVCLNSLMMQSFKDFEVHVCDDGSTDSTMDFLRERAKSFGYPLFIHTQENSGNFGSNINQAIGKTNGEHLLFIAADSFPEVDYLEVLNKYAGENRIVCGVRIQLAEVDGKMQGVDMDWRLKKETIPNFPSVIVDQPWGRLTGNGLCVPAEAFARYGKFKEVKGYGGEDNELIARLYFKGYLCWSVPDLQLFHHWHKSSTGGNASAFNKAVEQYGS